MAQSMTKLQAVNKILEAMGVKPVDALDTGGFSEAADAERMLDRESPIVQLEGWHGNRAISKEYTAASSKVLLNAGEIAIKAAGPTQYRNFDIRLVGAEYLVYDLDRQTSAFTNGDKIYLDVTYELTFANAPLYMQVAIVERCCQLFQRRWKGNPMADQAHAEERVRGENAASRASGKAVSDRGNPPPFALTQPGQDR